MWRLTWTPPLSSRGWTPWGRSSSGPPCPKSLAWTSPPPWSLTTPPSGRSPTSLGGPSGRPQRARKNWRAPQPSAATGKSPPSWSWTRRSEFHLLAGRTRPASCMRARPIRGPPMTGGMWRRTSPPRGCRGPPTVGSRPTAAGSRALTRGTSRCPSRRRHSLTPSSGSCSGKPPESFCSQTCPGPL